MEEGGIKILTSMPRTTQRRRTKAQVADPTHMPTPEAPAVHQSQQRQSRVRKVTLRMPQPKPSGVDSHRATPDSHRATPDSRRATPDSHRATPVLPLPPLPPPPPHGPFRHLPPPSQQPHAPHLAAGHPVPAGSQHNVHGPVIGIPPFQGQDLNALFYPPALPQVNFPHIPPYAASFLSQLLAMQQASNGNGLLPARHEAPPHTGRPAQGGAPEHVSVGEVNGVTQPDIATASSSVEARPGKTYPNKQISNGGKFHVPVRAETIC